MVLWSIYHNLSLSPSFRVRIAITVTENVLAVESGTVCVMFVDLLTSKNGCIQNAFYIEKPFSI